MKRLLAYLFIVLGLGLTFNINAEAEKKIMYDVIFCKIDNKVIPTFDSVSVYTAIKGTTNLKCP